jgi:hypothetical protein
MTSRRTRKTEVAPHPPMSVEVVALTFQVILAVETFAESDRERNNDTIALLKLR